MDLERAPSSSGRYWRREGNFTSWGFPACSQMPVGSWLGRNLFLVEALKLALCVVSILATRSALLPRLSFWAGGLTSALPSILYGLGACLGSCGEGALWCRGRSGHDAD